MKIIDEPRMIDLYSWLPFAFLFLSLSFFKGSLATHFLSLTPSEPYKYKIIAYMEVKYAIPIMKSCQFIYKNYQVILHLFLSHFYILIKSSFWLLIPFLHPIKLTQLCDLYQLQNF